ncbi:MAG: efflux RND transporter periplasmic adaptor subunit [bacterium]|jgi:RND family efflux transporter MFP subunit|nr:efflux RND transporter periplasmic adaptor subunit [bacterium]
MNRSTKILVWSLVALAALGTGLALTLRSHSPTGEHVSQYHCPMHPTYVSEKPGDCPICGMRLVPVEVAEASASPAATAGSGMAPPAQDSLATGWTCPMHPDVHADKTGACPTCGMDLVPEKRKPATAPALQTTYSCPMHPDVKTTQPGSCPSCGMDLVPARKAEAELGKGAGRRLLYYRNPMNPQVTSATPAKDEMGMDYVPVYSDAAATTGDVPGLSTVSTSAEGMRQAGVQVAVVQRGELGRGIRTVGQVRADEGRVRLISLKVGGWIEELWVQVTGQVVRKGQPLLTLYSPELLQAQEEFAQALAGARRMQGGATASEATALMSAARRRLELLDAPPTLIAELEAGAPARRAVVLDAPSAGFVTVKPVLQGQRVEAGMELFTVTDLDKVWVDAAIYESEAARAHVNQIAEISLPSDPGHPFKAHVQQVLPTLDPVTRTVSLRFRLDNPGLTLKPGMYVDVALETDTQPGLLIPASAILDSGLRQIVYVESNPGTFTPRMIRVGLRDGDQALVVSGLKEGERVASRGTFLLDSEARIRGALAETRTP